MYTLFSNEKLGMPVEQVRLSEIRQQIVAQRLSDEVLVARSNHLVNLPIRWRDRVRVWLALSSRPEPTATSHSELGTTPANGSPG